MDESLLAAEIRQAVKEDLAEMKAEEKQEEEKVARLLSRLELCVILPVTVGVIVLLAVCHLNGLCEAGGSTPIAGYAIIRVIMKKGIS